MRRWRGWLAPPVALMLVMAAAFGAAACGDDGGDDDGDGAPADSTATASAEGTFVPTPDPVAYPATVTDMLGREVRIDAKPERIAALSPTTVELVYAVGGESVTRSSSVDTPEEATAATDIGPSYQPNLELITAQDPDIIIADSVLQPQLLEQLEGLGVPVVYAGAQSFAEVLTAFETVGAAIDKNAEAEEAAAATLNTLTVLTTRLPGYQPKVLVVNGAPTDFFAAKPESYVGDLVRLLAGDNVAAGQPDVGRFPGYTKLSLEAIVAAQPDVVLAITAGPPGGTTITEELSSNPAWASLPAVQNNRVHEIDMEVYLQAPGPRAAQAVDELSKLLYPEVFGP